MNRGGSGKWARRSSPGACSVRTWPPSPNSGTILLPASGWLRRALSRSSLPQEPEGQMPLDERTILQWPWRSGCCQYCCQRGEQRLTGSDEHGKRPRRQPYMDGSGQCATEPGRLRCDVAARLTASAPQQTSKAPASWIAVGCSPRMTAASSIEAAGWRSSSSEDTAAGSLGSDEVISSQPMVWLVTDSSSSHQKDGQPISNCRPPNASPSSSEPSAAPAVASASGPATCGVPVEVRRRVSRNAA